MLEIISIPSGEFLHLQLRGQITSATAPELDQALNGALGGQVAPQCVLDLGALAFTSSAGLRIFLMLAKQIRNAGGRLVLCGAQPMVLKAFELSGFTRIFTIDLHAAFQLNNGGEAIGLFAPNGALQASVTFGPQSENISQGLYPDGNLSGDLRSLTNYTPRLPNSLAGRLRVIAITIQGSAVTIQWQAAINRLYRVEYKEDLAAPTWTPLAPAIQATAATASATDNPSGARQRFYRVVLAE